MTYSWIAARALGTEVVSYEVTSLTFWVFLFCFGLSGGFFMALGTILFTRKGVSSLDKEEISRASKCL